MACSPALHVILNLPTKGIRQARKPSIGHAEREVLPLNVGRADKPLKHFKSISY